MVIDWQRQSLLSPIGQSSLVLDKTITGRNWQIKRFCLSCNAKTTRIKSNVTHSFFDWYTARNKDGKVIGHLCAKCTDQYIRRPARKGYFDIKNIETHKKFGPRRINIQGKMRIQLDHNPRTGYCSKCSNNIYDGSCKKTDMHHIRYYLSNPLEHMIELCPTCHTKETWKQRKGEAA